MDRAKIGELMDRASKGDDGAFGSLASAVQDDLFRFALAHGLGREDAAEAAQETLLRAYAGRSRWRAGADALAWLCGIAMNVVRTLRRKGRRNGKVAWDLSSLGGPADDDDGPAAAAAGRADNMVDLLAALDKLPPRQREAVACRFLRHLSVRQTAEAMGCAEGTVKATLHAALGNLRDMMA
jgi:RNA polymerase sigma-70 factor (ECF subfamily)